VGSTVALDKGWDLQNLDLTRPRPVLTTTFLTSMIIRGSKPEWAKKHEEEKR